MKNVYLSQQAGSRGGRAGPRGGNRNPPGFSQVHIFLMMMLADFRGFV